MIELDDLYRVLNEYKGIWTDSSEDPRERVLIWLEKEDISQEAFQQLAQSFFHSAMGGMAQSVISGGSAAEYLQAALQTAFFTGWECHKQLGKPSNMMEFEDAE